MDSSKVMMLVLVMVMCSSSASCAMSVLGPMGSMFGGINSLFKGVGSGVTGAAKGIAKATGGTSKIKKVGGGNFGEIVTKMCNTCKSQNWQGKFEGKTDCSKLREGCVEKGF